MRCEVVWSGKNVSTFWCCYVREIHSYQSSRRLRAAYSNSHPQYVYACTSHLYNVTVPLVSEIFISELLCFSSLP
jgi:hypothetical protein